MNLSLKGEVWRGQTTVYDMLGQKVISGILPSSDGIATENISGLPTGLYLYTITTGNDIVQRGKVMIQH